MMHRAFLKINPQLHALLWYFLQPRHSTPDVQMVLVLHEVILWPIAPNKMCLNVGPACTMDA